MKKSEFITWKEENEHDFGALISIAYELDQPEAVADIIDSDSADEMVAKEAKEYGLDRVSCLLSKVEMINQDYYKINGYGNLENVWFSDWENAVEEIENYADFEEE